MGLISLVWIFLLQSVQILMDDVGKWSYLERVVGEPLGIKSHKYAIPVVSSNGTSADRSTFESTVRLGVPTLFSGVASHESALRSLSCAEFSARWPKASMRAEYTGKPEGETFVKLGDSNWVNDTKVPVGMNSPNSDCDEDSARASRPDVAPFVWHVKDRVARSIKQEISSMFKGIPFFERGSLIDAHTRDSMEFWFQQVGAGTFAHNDGYCHSVFSVQLRGQKKWRLMLPPDIEKLSRDIFDEFDSGIYNSVHKWEPDFEVVLQEGDGILFPPGYMHETRTVEGPSGEDRCATSVTFNIPLPLPSKFIREFLPRFSVSREIHHCMRRWESFVTAKPSAVLWDEPRVDSLQPRALAEEIFRLVDSDHNGSISITEIENYILSESENFQRKKGIHFGDFTFVFDPQSSPSEDMFREAFQVRAQDTLDMWDLDGDNQASFEEVKNVLEYFQYYKWRQELVDQAVSIRTEAGETVDLPIGGELFTKRLEIVETIMEQIRPEGPPVLRNRAVHRDEL
jgi:hypothetical protein